MKILPINFSAKANPVIKTRVQKTNSFEKSLQLPPCNPAYFQNFTSNPKPLTGYFNLPDNRYLEFQFSDYATKNYLTDETGKVDDDLVAKFSQMYFERFVDSEKSYTDEINYYDDLLKKRIPQSEIQPQEDDYGAEQYMAEFITRGAKTEFQYLRSYISHLNDNYRYREIEDIKSALEERKEYLAQSCYEETERVFQMSKTPHGYDFSDIDKKYNLAQHTAELIRMYGLEDNNDMIYNEVIEGSRKKDGTIDFYAAQEALNLIMSTGFQMSPKFVIETVRHFFDKDPKNKEIISSIMKELNSELFMINEQNTNFQNLMELCFDEDESYNPIKGEVLSLANKHFCDWVGQKVYQYRSQGINEDTIMKTYGTMLAIAKDKITQYFKAVEDENGNFNPHKLNLNKFINEELNKINLI